LKQSIRERLGREKRRIKKRLEPFIGGTEPKVEGRPELTQQRPTALRTARFALGRLRPLVAGRVRHAQAGKVS